MSFSARPPRVNLRPVPDPHAAPSQASQNRPDPDEAPPPCPCGAPTRWFVDRRTGKPVLFCGACVPPAA